MFGKLRALLTGVVFVLAPTLLAASPFERVFVLRDQNHLLQYKIDNAGAAALTKTYSTGELAAAFPAVRVEMKSGNILCTYNQDGTLKGRLFYNPATDSLSPYDGNPGQASSARGRLLEKPNFDESFRAESANFGEKSEYRESFILDDLRKTAGAQCREIFLFQKQVFCISGDHIDRVSRFDGTAVTYAPERFLNSPGSNLVAAAVSPWKEVFISDSAKNCVQRFLWHDDHFESNGSIEGGDLTTPGALAFSADGRLFVANSTASAAGLLRYRFVLNGTAQASAEAEKPIGLEGSAALSLALARPVGYVISEKTVHLEKPSPEEALANGAHGNIEAGVIDQDTNAEAAGIGLIQYAPGGYHTDHNHSQKEQVVVVLEGRALWDVGEIEKEVGPGDVIFCPRFVKHGYKVLGDKPFRFYEINWMMPDQK